MMKKILIIALILSSAIFGKGEISFQKQKEKKAEEELTTENKKNKENSSYGLRTKIVEIAKKQLGKPYLWGASGNEQFDCSSFVQYVYKTAANIELPRVSYQQAVFKPKITTNIKIGDLLFFETLGKGRVSHVGIYIGNREFVHASSASKKVVISKFSGFYQEKFSWAISVL